MKVPLEWLGEWVEWRGTPAELAEKLTQSGTEVVAMHTTGCQVRGVVAAKIMEKKPHPNADRLSLCLVDDGTGPRQVVCGAKNHQAGDMVPLAKPGTIFSDGMTIKAAKLRGENSEGMLCSAKELGLAEEAEGLLILPTTTSLGVTMDHLFPGETVMEVEITSNRPDLASVSGLARELSALGVSLKKRVEAPATDDGGLKGWQVSNEDAKLCAHYTLTGFEVKAGIESPDWMKKRLVAAGLRSLGLLVDVTNYVLLETGQPLHVFDAAGIQGTTIMVRRAKAGEVISGLDGGKHSLASNDLVIADGKGVLALAGVVGGTSSAVQPTSQKILLEVASFDAGTVRRTARRLSITTESSKRFARGGLDPDLVERARQRVIQLLQDAGALVKCLGVTSAGGPSPAKVEPVPLRWDKAERILGGRFDQRVLGERLEALGFRESKSGWVAPSWRQDVREEIDLFEELIRLSDLGKVPAGMDSLVEVESEEDRADQLRRDIRAFLVERGYFEVLSGALVRLAEAGSARLSVAAGPEAAGYRQSLWPNLGRAAGRNISRGVTDLKLFELGRVSLEGGKEEMRLGLLVTGRERPVHWQEAEVNSDRFSLEGVWQELKKRFSGLGQPLTLREMSPSEKKLLGVKAALWVAEGKVTLGKAPLASFTPVSSYPGIQRDLALVLPERVPFAEVEKAIRAVAPMELESLVVFDRFVDASGKKVPAGFLSLGCRLQFRSTARTLTEDEVVGWESTILQSLASRCEAKLRTVL